MSQNQKAHSARIVRAIFAAAALATLLLTFEVEATPSFARRYETSCATCHQAYPRLNAIGESFRLNGYQFLDEERYRKRHPIEMGDEAYKRLWPRALWPSDIPRYSPLSFIMRNMAEVDLDGSRPTTTTYLLPEEVELVWTGNLGGDITFYGDVIFLQKDFGGLEPDSWLTVKGWVQFNDLFVENALNVRVGTVGTQTIGLFTARDANFYGTHFYAYTNALMPRVNAAEAGLASFEGNPFLLGPQAGIEVNGFGGRWFYAAGIANGDLNDPASGPLEDDVVIVGMGKGGGSDTYLQLAWKFGGAPFDQVAVEGEETLTTSAEFWRDDSLTLSLFAYNGSAELDATDQNGVTTRWDDDFWRLGFGALQQYRDITVGLQYTGGSHDRPYGYFTPESVDVRTYHVEALWFAYPWLVPFVRYEGIEFDVPRDVPGLAPDQDQVRWIAGAKAMLRPNVFLIFEAAAYEEGAELEEGFDGTLFGLLGLSF